MDCFTLLRKYKALIILHCRSIEKKELILKVNRRMSSNGTKKLIQEITDDFVTLAEENAIKVRFVETQAHHRPRDDVFVVYEICNGFKPSSRDWIGLYSGRTA